MQKNGKDLPTPEYTGPFIIEKKELGIWDYLDNADDLETALTLASVYTNDTREEWLRIIDNNNKII